MYLEVQSRPLTNHLQRFTYFVKVQKIDIYIITDRRDADKGAYYPCDELFTDEYEMMSEVQSMFEDGMLFNTSISSDILEDEMIAYIDDETLAELVDDHSDDYVIKVDEDGYCVE